VAIHPELVEILRWHLDEFGTAPDGRLFVGPHGGTIGDSTHLGVWHKTRARPDPGGVPLAAGAVSWRTSMASSVVTS
jgi:hypothetical protein